MGDSVYTLARMTECGVQLAKHKLQHESGEIDDSSSSEVKNDRRIIFGVHTQHGIDFIDLRMGAH